MHRLRFRVAVTFISLSHGSTKGGTIALVADAVRAIGVTEVTYYRWRNEYGGLKGDQVKRLKELETENTRLRRAVSDLTLDKLILTEAAKGNF
jgi:putative transposase